MADKYKLEHIRVSQVRQQNKRRKVLALTCRVKRS